MGDDAKSTEGFHGVESGKRGGEGEEVVV